MLTVSVRSSNILGWIIEVHDSALPWGSPPVARFDQVERPTWKQKQAYLRTVEHQQKQSDRRR